MTATIANRTYTRDELASIAITLLALDDDAFRVAWRSTPFRVRLQLAAHFPATGE